MSSKHQKIVLPYIIKYVPKELIKNKNVNLYGFDLDHTIISPKSGSIWPRDSHDWKYLKFCDKFETIDELFRIIEEDEQNVIIIFTNQGGVVSVPSTSKSCLKFTNKIEEILKDISERSKKNTKGNLIDRIWIYASTRESASMKKLNNKKSNGNDKKPSGIDKFIKKKKKEKTVENKVKNTTLKENVFTLMRKPNIGMSQEFVKDLLKNKGDVEYKWIYYCGDAGGRPNDHSDSDLQFAQNLNIEFKTPEQVFSTE
ncbi:hypothetical protein TBLA_0B09450 [Henningerozyma blattae CBS 6284]|uniref:DNA 3'-phosphatase n=1 Tax=Henningerozyma blattae (strain ATCC 34711 / CBS 6284 / DSM 70876 / NBRC 10599 / NRRL Y-10934 / UCD 77-7) TaxID=1071380 RepID=I2H060_HENB6|nr:hypothetical protein TBLA_0B09450 [Tetrapisispora blattae CBS 6284]CCH59762.1 hypothetical protein TBLA_0B09450 [Tetrapisispora blattae CBS 6284]